MNREMRRKSRLLRVFTSIQSYLCLVNCYFVKYMEDMVYDYAYIKIQRIKGKNWGQFWSKKEVSLLIKAELVGSL